MTRGAQVWGIDVIEQIAGHGGVEVIEPARDALA
jgi:hypothetical protein